MPGTGSAYAISTLEANGAASVTFSPDQTRIYVSRYDGKIDVFDTATHAKVATWNVGTSLGAVTVSEDGTFLLAVERFAPPSTPGNPPSQPPPQSSTFYRIDTANGAVTTYTRSGNAYADIEIVDSHKAILTGGQNQVSVFDLDTQSYSVLPNAVYYGNNSTMVEDKHLTLLAERGISNGPLFIYDDRVGAITATGDDYQTLGGNSGGNTGYNYGHQAISEAGGLVAQFIYYNTINLYDLNLHFIRGMAVDGPVDGLAFDVTGNFLFARSDSGQLNKYDLATGAIVDSFAVGSVTWTNNASSGDQIVMNGDGKIMLVHDTSTGKLQLIDLTGRDERFEGTAGPDAFAGGKGDDTYVINNPGDTITELKYDGTDTALASIDYTLPNYVENLTLTGAAVSGTGNSLANVIIGNAGANVLTGGGGNDYLVGLGGDDVLVGNADAASTLEGGTGDDWYYVNRTGDSVIERAGEGNDRVYASVSFTLSAGQAIEMLGTADASGTAAINLTGNTLGQVISGNAGANVLVGGGGNDYLLGAGGDDILVGNADAPSTLQGGTGNDWYYVYRTGDSIVESVGEGNDRILSAVNYTLSSGQEIETLSTIDPAAITAINLTGNAFAQTIVGNAGANILTSGGGADYLVGGGGDDTLVGNADTPSTLQGGTGNDWYYVFQTGDSVVEFAGQGNDRIVTAVSYTLSPGVEIESLFAANQGGVASIDIAGNEFGQAIGGTNGANVLAGNGGADDLAGFGGDDILLGGDGNDTLNGGAGHDILNGGNGADLFVFADALGSGNVDTIQDFASGTDRVLLDHSVFTGLSNGPLSASAFVLGTVAQDADDRIIYDSTTGNLYFDADGSGAGAAIQFAHVDPGTTIVASDFVVI